MLETFLDYCIILHHPFLLKDDAWKANWQLQYVGGVSEVVVWWARCQVTAWGDLACRWPQVFGAVRSGEEPSCLLSGQGGRRRRRLEAHIPAAAWEQAAGAVKGCLPCRNADSSCAPASLEPQFCPPLSAAFSVLSPVSLSDCRVSAFVCPKNKPFASSRDGGKCLRVWTLNVRLSNEPPCLNQYLISLKYVFIIASICKLWKIGKRT